MTLALAIWLIGAATTAATWGAVIRAAQRNIKDPNTRTEVAAMHAAWNTNSGRAATLLTMLALWPVFTLLAAGVAIHGRNQDKP